MKKNFLLIFAAAAMLAGGVACSKEGDVSSEATGETGALKVSITWVQQASETKAATSTSVIPVTTWANNIDDMWLVLSGSGVIKDVRSITPETSNGNSSITRLFNDIEVGTYDVYVVANVGKITTPFGTGAVNPSTAMGNSLKGTSMSAFLLNLQTITAASTVGNDTASTTAYNEPSEIFIAKTTGVTINQDATTTVSSPLALTRAVSLLRVRINQVYDSSIAGSIDNSDVDFRTSGSVATRLRYHGTGIGVADAANSTVTPYGIQGITTTAASLNNALYSGKTYKNASEFVAANYGSGADMGLSNSDFTLWNEYLMLPGGSDTDGNLKFNVALTGLAPVGYVAIDATTGAQTAPLTTPTIVTWVGQVSGAVKPNQIIELNLRLLSAGFIGPDIPTPTQYGNLEISLNLLDWDTNVIYVPIEL